MTPAEKKLWQVLRGNKLDGLYFRRQHAIGAYIVDFICVQQKLVIEIDGSVHQKQEEFDEERTRWLGEEKGYRVIRIRNDDVLRNIDKVIEEILEAVKGPHPALPACGGETGSPPFTGGARGGR